jgi:hypothetical protein
MFQPEIWIPRASLRTSGLLPLASLTAYLPVIIGSLPRVVVRLGDIQNNGHGRHHCSLFTTTDNKQRNSIQYKECDDPSIDITITRRAVDSSAASD